MRDYLIGAGGWAYFQVPKVDRLKAYAQAFNFVEVNSTFYEIPDFQLVKSWRERTPFDFEFSVRCHNQVTHVYQLEPVTKAFNIFKKMMQICRLLKTRFLVLETPPSLTFDSEKIISIRNFLSSLELKEIRLVWEIRSVCSSSISQLFSLMNDFNIIYCVDLLNQNQPFDSDIVYTRLFGKGKHTIYQFTDDELLEVDTRILNKDPELAIISFHNVKMYKDAARFRVYKKRNVFPRVTKSVGEQSLREVLLEDAIFPTTKHKLLYDQGWKIIDLTYDTKERARILLERLPDKQFHNIDEVMKSLSKT